MKKKLLFGIGIALSLCTISCSVDDNEPAPNPGGSGNNSDVLSGSGKLSGNITKNILVKKGSYTLEGVVKVNSGVTLTIEPGATFTASTATTSSLVILQGGKIMAEGTASEPIIFTTDKKTPGDWGGITIFGEAPVKGINGSTSILSEDGNMIKYGGNKADSNSGVMKYVRVEYGGKKIGDGTSETNSMTFYAVGTGTILENLVAYKGTDDGFEFFGGTASAKNLISYGNFDDSFDWQDSWSGQENSNWFAFQTGVGNYGMEIESSSQADNTPPKISNITLIRAAGTKPEVANSPEVSAIQFKKQGTGIFSNVYAQGYQDTDGQKAYAVVIQDNATETGQLNQNKITIASINYVNSSNPGVWYLAEKNTTKVQNTSDVSVTKTTLTLGNWAKVGDIDLLAAIK